MHFVPDGNSRLQQRLFLQSVTASLHAFLINNVSFSFSSFLVQPLNVCVLSNERNPMNRGCDLGSFLLKS